MLKNKPLLIAAIVFGSVGLVLTALGCIIFLTKDPSGYSNIAKSFGLNQDSVTMASVCELATVFEFCAFILGYKSLTHESGTE